MNEISAAIGVVPRLKSLPVLPENVFLPERIQGTKQKWQVQACPNPSRGTAASRNEIHFIERDNKLSAREELAQTQPERLLQSVKLPDETLLFLNLTDLDYYELGLMHVDHWQPSASLMARLKEMVGAMNDDPSFRVEMENSPFNDRYFLELPGGKVVGSYWLYMVFHNSMQNLWFLLASDNSGSGKLAVDPVAWLQTFELGREYLQHVQVARKQIEKDDILYKLSDGTSLKDSFVSWVYTTKKELIKAYQSIVRFKEGLREQVSGLADNPKALKKARLSIALSRGTFFPPSSPGDSSSSVPSLESLDSEEVYSEVRGELQLDPVYKASLELSRSIEKQKTREIVERKQKAKKKLL